MRILLASLALCLDLCLATALAGGDMTPRAGWQVLRTEKDHAALLADLKAAVAAHGMGVVTEAGPTATARARGIEIPENRVLGVFNNDVAVRVLALSTPAMIEAPIRFYVTENADGTATLSYKTPGFVFAPYLPEAGAALAEIAADLDAQFAAIAAEATE